MGSLHRRLEKYGVSKQERVLEQNWYGNEGKKGLKLEIMEEENILGERSKMMEMPQMTTEDLIRLAGKQKNGKAAGTDCIKAEVLKHLVKKQKICRYSSKSNKQNSKWENTQENERI